MFATLYVNIECSIAFTYCANLLIQSLQQGSDCAHIKINLIKKKQHIPREAMHRIEIKVLREEKKTNDGRESTFDNKNIYNLTLGVVMDFRVYFGPIMLPLKVHMDPLNKCFDSTYNIESILCRRIAVRTSTENGKVNRRKCIKSTALTTKSKSNSMAMNPLFLLDTVGFFF